MKIREANLEDLKAIVEVWHSFLDEHDSIILEENKKLGDMLVRDREAYSQYEKYVKNNIESGNGVSFIAEENAKIVGYSLGIIKDEIPIFKIKKYGYISDLFVKKGFRGKGISSRLKERMIEWFKSKGLKYASIVLYADNQIARSIYKKWGFFDYKLEVRKKI